MNSYLKFVEKRLVFAVLKMHNKRRTMKKVHFFHVQDANFTSYFEQVWHLGCETYKMANYKAYKKP